MGAGRGEDQGRDHRELEQAARAPAPVKSLSDLPVGVAADRDRCSTTPDWSRRWLTGAATTTSRSCSHRAFHEALAEGLGEESPVALIDNDDFKTTTGLRSATRPSRTSANGKHQPQLATA